METPGPLLNGLVDPAGRALAAERLAASWGVECVLVLVRDPELGVLHPAPGFRQTLPGGPGWRALLARCDRAGRVRGEVAFPVRTRLVPVCGEVDATADAVLLLIGGNDAPPPPPGLEAIGFPLLAGLLRAESRVVAASGLVANAEEARMRAESLTAALDAARGQLARSFADADRLNRALRDLNTTLERRVAERTAQLETEMAERQKAEEQLRQSQKMEAVGQLTGGLAHDFNNLLAGITGSLELLSRRIGQGRAEEAGRYIAAAEDAARRAAALTHRLLAFSRRQTLAPCPTDPNRLVGGMAELVRRTVGPSVVVGLDLGRDAWTILVDPNQLENALLNLCINGRDAMPDGGRLLIETQNRSLAPDAARALELEGGDYLCLGVSDTGTGMTPEVLARAFDPFFTTKPIGLGTGLGLSMIYGFAGQSGGRAVIRSAPGAGTTVSLFLPRHRGAAEAATGAAATPGPVRSDSGGVVLVVDDEATVRMLMVEVLNELGLATLEAADAAQAMVVLRAAPRVDLLLTDVGLPGAINGRQLADQARLERPGLGVLFVTGYAEQVAVGHDHLEPGMHVLAKPFGMNELGRRVSRLLPGRSPPPADR